MSLLYFYDQSCELCKEMNKVLDEFENQSSVDVIKIDIDESEEMKELFTELATDVCEGVPFVYNQESENFICGLCTLEDLKKI